MKSETVTMTKPAAVTKPVAAKVSAVKVKSGSKKSLRKDAEAAAKAATWAAEQAAKKSAAPAAPTAPTVKPTGDAVMSAALTSLLTDTRKPVSKAKPVVKKEGSKAKASPTAQNDAGASEKVADVQPQAQAVKTAQTPAKPLPQSLRASFVTRKYVAGTTMYSLAEETRPSSGKMLFAHTHAALTVLGMLDAARPAVSKSHLITLIGQRAVTYHLNDTGNFESGPNQTIRLSILGYNKFSARLSEAKFSVDAAIAYQEAMLDGKASEKYGIRENDLYACMFK